LLPLSSEGDPYLTVEELFEAICATLRLPFLFFLCSTATISALPSFLRASRPFLRIKDMCRLFFFRLRCDAVDRRRFLFSFVSFFPPLLPVTRDGLLFFGLRYPLSAVPEIGGYVFFFASINSIFFPRWWRRVSLLHPTVATKPFLPSSSLSSRAFCLMRFGAHAPFPSRDTVPPFFLGGTRALSNFFLQGWSRILSVPFLSPRARPGWLSFFLCQASALRFPLGPARRASFWRNNKFFPFLPAAGVLALSSLSSNGFSGV